jgi:hypothetical protein
MPQTWQGKTTGDREIPQATAKHLQTPESTGQAANAPLFMITPCIPAQCLTSISNGAIF